MERWLKICAAFGLAWWGVLRGVNALMVGVKSWQFRGIDLTNGYVDFTINFLIKNPLIVGLTLNRIYGDLFMQGQKVGYINSTYNYYLSGGRTHQIPVGVRIKISQLGAAALANIQSGDIKSLTIAFDGEILIGSAGVPIPINWSTDYEELTAKD